MTILHLQNGRVYMTERFLYIAENCLLKPQNVQNSVTHAFLKAFSNAMKLTNLGQLKPKVIRKKVANYT